MAFRITVEEIKYPIGVTEGSVKEGQYVSVQSMASAEVKKIYEQEVEVLSLRRLIDAINVRTRGPAKKAKGA